MLQNLARLLEFYSQRASRVRRDIYRLAAQAAEFRFAVLGLEPAAERKIVCGAEKIPHVLKDEAPSFRVKFNEPHGADDLLIFQKPRVRHPVRENHAVHTEIAVVRLVSEVAAVEVAQPII